MIVAADTSAFVRYLAGDQGPTSTAIFEALEREELRLPAPVVTELLSHPVHGPVRHPFVSGAAILDIVPGFWMRAGETRRVILARNLRARTLDALIAQCCIDADIPIIAHDPDFRHFAAWCGLKLVAV